MDDMTKIGLIGLALGIALITFVWWRVRASARGKGTVPKGYNPSDSAAYQQFFSQYINSDGNFGAWHDGLDERVFAKLSPAERERAESALLQTLPDWRSIIGLGAMRSQKAVAPLQGLLKNADGEQLVRVEQALARIGGQNNVYGAKTRSVLARKDKADKSARMEAAMALSEQPTAESAATLLDAIKQDPEYLVRYHAAKALLHIYGYTKTEVEALMTELAPGLSNGAVARPKPAAFERIEALIANRKIGTST